jgi:hypothetical protein
MTLYEIYDGVECTWCGSRNTRDRGPYEDGPDATFGPDDAAVHMMSCNGCTKWFDAAPEAVVRRRLNYIQAITGKPVEWPPPRLLTPDPAYELDPFRRDAV